MSTIKIQHITEVYGTKDNACTALHDVSLEIKKGEFVAICGTIGSGKTTLFNIISGIDTHYEGTCFIDDVDIKTLSEEAMAIKRRREIGIIFQFFNLISFLTVEENVKLTAQLDGTIRIFIYGFYFIIMIIAVFVLFNLLSQYMAQIKRELFLLNIIGMSKKNIQIQFIQRAIIFTTISIFLFIGIEYMIMYLLQSLTTISFDILLLMKYTISYCMVLLCFMVILTLLILRNTAKSST